MTLLSWYAVAGYVAIALGGLMVYHANSLQSAEMEQRLKEVSKGQAELDAEIQSLNFILVFDQVVDIRHMDKSGFIVRLNKTNHINRSSRIEVKVEPSLEGQREGGIGVTGLQFSTTVYAGGKQKRGRVQSIMPWEQEYRELPVPLSVFESLLKPFDIIRDIRESEIAVFLPQNLAERVIQVQLVANASDDFSRRLLLFSREISRASWVESEYNLNQTLRTKEDVQTVWILSNGHADLRVTLEGIRWETDKSNSGYEFKIPYKIKR